MSCPVFVCTTSQCHSFCDFGKATPCSLHMHQPAWHPSCSQWNALFCTRVLPQKLRGLDPNLNGNSVANLEEYFPCTCLESKVGAHGGHVWRETQSVDVHMFGATQPPHPCDASPLHHKGDISSRSWSRSWDGRPAEHCPWREGNG